MIKLYPITLVFFLAFNSLSRAQSTDTLNVDNAFFRARALAFDGKREEAKALCRRILARSPAYSDVEVLLGRIYVWSDQYDSARYVLKRVIDRKPYEDAFLALSDLERWNDRPRVALQVANEGLRSFPASEDLLLRKARAVDDTGGTKAAYLMVDSMLRRSPSNTEARTYAESIKNRSYKNKVLVGYTFDHFDKRFANDWHLYTLAYTRRTRILGSVTGRVNYANRFNTTGYQGEIDMYPSLGKKMYAYLNFGYSEAPMFPKQRFGASVYRSLPRSFEAELGVRYLGFTTPTVIYTGSIGKYYRSFWFSLRPFFIRSNFSSSPFRQFSQSYLLVTRYYFGSADDFLSLTLGTGVSPDDRSKQALLESPSLRSRRIYLEYQKKIAKKYIVAVGAGVLNEEFVQGTLQRGNDYNFTFSLERLF
jgi:YaiO family outer membrane protein